MEQNKYWNDAAETKDFTTPFQIEAFSKYVDKGASVLDVGCGYGRTLNQLYENGFRALKGIDFSVRMIARGKALFPYLDLGVQTSPDIDFPDESVDAVILCAVLTCIISNEDQIHLFNEIRRILKPGGIIYVNDFLLNTDERNTDRYRMFESTYGIYGVFELPEGAILRHHDKLWVRNCLRPFEPLYFEELAYTTMNGNTSNGYCYIGRKKD